MRCAFPLSFSLPVPPAALRYAALALLCWMLAGCATRHENTCADFEEHRKQADYTTTYRFSESDSQAVAHHFKPLPRGTSVVVRLYKMRADPSRIKPCRDLTIRKELYLQRAEGSNVILEEVREFYTDQGTLIASKTEVLSDQLRTSGYYSGETPLPIPQQAPPGRYRIVSKLVLKTRGRQPHALVLGRTSATFQVLALDKK
jgi:hypothetical protein